MGTIYRTTISIPQELKDRMDAAGEQVNWSSLAARAFESKLLEIELRSKRSMSTKDVVKRLQAAKEQDAQEDYEEGKQAGREWAEKTATPKELRRLAEYLEDSERSNVCWWDVEGDTGISWNAPFGAPDCLVFAIWPKRDSDRDAPEEFWEKALGDEHRRCWDAGFLRGFGKGAVEVWHEVEDEL